jgi:hypothetical protein
VLVDGLGLGGFVDLGLKIVSFFYKFRIVEERFIAYRVVLGIKRWFDELFDDIW